MGPQLPHDVEAAAPGQHHVQHNHVVQAGQGVIQAVRSGIHYVHGVFLLTHNLAQRLGQTHLVLYNQHTHRSASLT